MCTRCRDIFLINFNISASIDFYSPSRYQQASSHAVSDPDRALDISISVDEKAKTFTIQVIALVACFIIYERSVLCT